MASPGHSYRFPYTPTPGGSTPGPEVTPEQGIRDLWGFFWLAVLNSVIIAVAGLVVWFLVR
jgi:hypothetical protein